MALETLIAATARLVEAGFSEDLVAESGALHAAAGDGHYEVTGLRIVETIRFEGTTDPDEEAILFALSDPDGNPVGIYVTPYGPEMPERDVLVVPLLQQLEDRPQ